MAPYVLFCEDSLSEEITESLLSRAKVALQHRRFTDECTEITPNDRSKVITLIFDAANKNSSSSEAAFLAVELLDRYIQKSDPRKDELDMLAISCLKIAEKVEDVKISRNDDLADACGLSPEELLKAEVAVINALNFEVDHVTLLTVLQRILVGTKLATATTIHADGLHISSVAVWLAKMLLHRADICQKFAFTELALACTWIASQVMDVTFPNVKASDFQCDDSKCRLCTKAILAAFFIYSSSYKGREKALKAISGAYTRICSVVECTQTIPPTPAPTVSPKKTAKRPIADEETCERGCRPAPKGKCAKCARKAEEDELRFVYSRFVGKNAAQTQTA
jgi:hypothetical protein